MPDGPRIQTRRGSEEWRDVNARRLEDDTGFASSPEDTRSQDRLALLRHAADCYPLQDWRAICADGVPLETIDAAA